jgi:hypothetical protein
MRSGPGGRGRGWARGWKVLALGVALTSIAMACGDDDDDDDTTDQTTADTVSETTAEATETTAESTETTAESTETTEAAAESPVTVDDNGRLVSGECVEGTANADETLGLTEDTLNFAMVGIDFGPLADIGFAASGINVVEAAVPFIDAINEAGGICGRTIDYQPVQYDILAGEGGAACIQVSEDRRNVLVFGQGGWNEATCVAESGTVTVSQQDFNESSIEAAGGEGQIMFSTPPSVEETYRATVENFLPDLEALQPIGVWYGAVFAGQGDAVEEAVFPILDEAGIEYIPYRTDTLGPSDPEGAAILSAAATDFVAQGVGAVLGFTQTTNHVGLQGEMAQQGHIPQWLWSNVGSNSSNELFAEAFAVTEAANGERLMSYTLTPAANGDNPWSVTCNEEFQELGGEVYEPGTFEYSAIANVCLQIDFLMAVLTLTGPEITNEGLVAAIEQVPPFYEQNAAAPIQFGPGDRFANHTMVELLYDGATNSYAVNGDPIELG